jgi:hypothetical protein
MSLLSSIVVAALFAWPWLRTSNRERALIWLVAPHMFLRFIGLSFLVPGVVTLLTPFSKKREGWAHSVCVNTHDGKIYRLEELSGADVISLGDILCGYVNHPEIKSLGPDGKKCQAHTRGLLGRMAINGGLQNCIGKEVSRFEQGKSDFIENIDDVCIHYDGGRVAANESLVSEISARGLGKTTKLTGLDRKTIRAVLNRQKVRGL